MRNYHYLALGDSYTIGESVLLNQNFPYQLVQLLRKKGFNFAAPEIIAKTGWTTEELKESIKSYKFLPRYDLVTLLIGVNNQYRGLGVIQYKEEFEELLQSVLDLANGKRDHVFIVSIPDYSVTPFAAAMDKEKIRKEIDVFNTVNKALSIQYKVNYTDITEGTREARNDPKLVASDKLHPSVKEYAKWADKLLASIAPKLK